MKNYLSKATIGLLSLLFNIVLVILLYIKGRDSQVHVGHSPLSLVELDVFVHSDPPPTQSAFVSTSTTISPDHHNFSEPGQYLLAVMVISSPDHLDRRNTIRKTWLKGLTKQTVAKFVIGTKDLGSEVVTHLEKENSQHSDLLLLQNVSEDNSNIARKILASLIWFDKNLKYSYLLKCNDNSLALLNKFIEDLTQRDHSQGLYWGYFVGNIRPPTVNGHWDGHNWKFCDTYIPFAYGGGYVLSADVIHRIADRADALIVYKEEDVSVGAWTVVDRFERKHDVRFNTAKMSRGCGNHFMVTQVDTLKNMTDMYTLYEHSGKLCKKEHITHEDRYNWKLLPSQCYNS